MKAQEIKKEELELRMVENARKQLIKRIKIHMPKSQEHISVDEYARWIEGKK